ncbi:TetR/AcrR family transcriptional regulator [Candidatus Xianfuyuplasma coldseepsis]|uniref:TetR/AcrR family transcriptional regulator n=1 Tax=Candidatus Xianfuyuplasma coldseepsis TaxID=2782163 RepID=A0A7L7KT96_9MOLU|nr:TetR/AcrR family transcriptional regulator [Xianfuyuplasma coldseepsis]QMS85512.1 TetR/AcrR family transcriptional regulator [Xianfuyuplasma coldseepsis]
MTLSARSQRKINSIIEQASRLFVRNGYHKVTMESIAQYANVSKVTLYKYFNDKQMLYEHIIQLNQDKAYNHLKDLVTDLIPYLDKVDQLFEYEVESYYDTNRPNLDESIILSLDCTKAIRKHKTRMRKLRQKLFHQGRMEEFICDELSDKVLESYYQAIVHGWISQQKQMLSLSEEEQLQWKNILLQAMKKCQ